MSDLSNIDNEKWKEAQRRADVVRPLIINDKLPLSSAKLAADELGISVRQVYKLVKRCLESDKSVTSLIRRSSSGGRGKSRISSHKDAIIQEVIDKKLSDKRKFSFQTMIKEVNFRCRKEGIKPPSPATIRRRVKQAPAKFYRQRNNKTDQAVPLFGKTPEAPFPLACVQMDHTNVDIILVDSDDREPIGTPFLTVIIDVFSRCIAGMHLDLEDPSATSVGLCLTHLASDKTAWLLQKGIEAEWPIQGKPFEIGVDNAKEFHSKAFERGCNQHGIKITYRPPGLKHWGGVVERVIGTFMKMVHEAPGTKFSNVAQRGSYDSERKACLTFEEFEHYFTIAVAQVYHYSPHREAGGRNFIPIKRLLEADPVHIKNSVPNLQTYLIDFLPVSRRTLRREGFILDYITYYDNAFHNWLREGRLGQTFIIRRDPRDLSRIYVSIPDGTGYVEAPCRNLTRPSITLFEHRAILRRLRSQTTAKIDEDMIFRGHESMKYIEKTSKTKTLKTRREKERKRRATNVHIQKQQKSVKKDDKTNAITFNKADIKPYEVELW